MQDLEMKELGLRNARFGIWDWFVASLFPKYVMEMYCDLKAKMVVGRDWMVWFGGFLGVGFLEEFYFCIVLVVFFLCMIKVL